MSAVTGGGGVQPRTHGRIFWALADGWVLAKRNLVQIPRIPELLVFATIQPVGSHGWQALAWCVGILLIFVPLSVTLYRRVAAR